MGGFLSSLLCSLNNLSACNKIAIFIFVVMPSNQCIKCSNRNRICKRCQLLIIVSMSMSINIETKIDRACNLYSMGVAGTITDQKRTKNVPMPDASTTHIVRWNILMIIPLFWPIKYSTLRWQILYFCWKMFLLFFYCHFLSTRAVNSFFI